MELLPLARLGAHERVPGVVDFGLLLPWVSAANGNRLWVKIIHETDQFLQHVPPLMFELTHSLDPKYGDYWSGTVDIAATPPPPGSAWGTPGRYIYRYFLRNPNVGDLDWIVDPCAREFGVGKLSAFTLGYVPYAWSAQEAAWRTPKLNDLVLYELMLAEFATDLDEAIDRLGYLADLGVNCLEIMPVSNVAMTVDWGFLPIGYFGVDERFGKRRDFQRFVDAAHQRGLAVILDAVYGHTGAEFPYCDVYRRLRYNENPFLGGFAKDLFGESTDFAKTFTRDFFYTVNEHWLDVYHLDGFRYDCVPNYWDGPMGEGYAKLTYTAYQTLKAKIGGGGPWLRFDGGPGEPLRLIQCAEQLEAPEEVLEKTYSNCTWQNGTLGAAKWAATGNRDALTALGFSLGLAGYPTSVTTNGETIPKAALQYIENHDHSRFVANFGTIGRDNELFREGDRAQWFRVQPYLIGVLLAQGLPMLWQGQEFAENYFVPDSGLGRVMMLRPVRWDYFYDEIGRSTAGLVRRLLALRRGASEFRNGAHYFYNDWARYQSRGLLLFSRYEGERFSLVALNFSDTEQTVPFWFPMSGDYEEQLHHRPEDRVNGVAALTERWLTIPGNYGRVWSRM
jgi:maltooligosyltrehalose trehalohydrolase